MILRQKDRPESLFICIGTVDSYRRNFHFKCPEDYNFRARATGSISKVFIVKFRLMRLRSGKQILVHNFQDYLLLYQNLKYGDRFATTVDSFKEMFESI